MKVKIVCISDSDKHFSSAIDEYLKRMGKEIEIITIKPEKHGTRDQIIAKETDKIIDRLSKNDDYKILLSKDGKPLTTEEFTETIFKNHTITFIIGWPYGLDEQKLETITNMKLSFGKITLPHGLAKLTILEQVYRAKSIIEGREYHY